MIDYKQMYEEEARKFQQETRRTSDLSLMIDHGLAILAARGHRADNLGNSKTCGICQWMIDAKALREKPINA